MQYTYCVVKEIFSNNDGEYIGYGLAAYEKECMITKVSDISICRETVQRMADCYTENRLSPMHLQDAVDDMLAN